MSRLLRCMFFILIVRWDDELAEVAQIWADQCTGVMYQHHNSGWYIFIGTIQEPNILSYII